MFRNGRRGTVIYRPFRDAAGLTEQNCSRPLRRRIADFGAERSGRNAVDALAEHYQIEVPLYTVDKVIQEVGNEANRFNHDQPVNTTTAATVQVSGLDGSMIPIVDFKSVSEVKEPEKKADKRKRRECKWKEIRVCTVHDPKKAEARYGVSYGSSTQAGLMAKMVSEQSGMNEKTYIHAVGDGARWIAEEYEKQFGTQCGYLLDFYHVCEYLAAAASGCVGGTATLLKKNRWIEKQKQWLKQSRADQVVQNLERHLEPEDFTDENAPVRVCWRYLKNRLNQLDYQAALEAELPIGSGETESAHRHLIQQRLKLPGAWWSEKNAANMAQLRVTRANGQWNEFWNKQAV